MKLSVTCSMLLTLEKISKQTGTSSGAVLPSAAENVCYVDQNQDSHGTGWEINTTSFLKGTLVLQFYCRSYLSLQGL